LHRKINFQKTKFLPTLVLAVFASGCFNNLPVPAERSSAEKSGSPSKTASVPESARLLKGTAVHISDGDTFIIEDENGKRTTVRIHAIDAPELAQDFGLESRENLRALIADQQVEVSKHDTDQFQRIVGSVFIGEKNVGLEQIAGGFAWHFKQYQKEQTVDERQAYSKAEETARNLRLGLWRENNPLPPKDYRRTHNPRR
jgi:endonuclease YncB( thermonuclease family)